MVKTPIDPLDAITVSFEMKGGQAGVLANMDELKFDIGPVRRWERRNE